MIRGSLVRISSVTNVRMTDSGARDEVSAEASVCDGGNITNCSTKNEGSACDDGISTKSSTTSSRKSMSSKRIRFNPQMRLILIPCIREYRNAKILDQLWYSSSDYFTFQNSAHSEIRQLAAFEGTSHSEARFKLYQQDQGLSYVPPASENARRRRSEQLLEDWREAARGDGGDGAAVGGAVVGAVGTVGAGIAGVGVGVRGVVTGAACDEKEDCKQGIKEKEDGEEEGADHSPSPVVATLEAHPEPQQHQHQHLQQEQQASKDAPQDGDCPPDPPHHPSSLSTPSTINTPSSPSNTDNSSPHSSPMPTNTHSPFISKVANLDLDPNLCAAQGTEADQGWDTCVQMVADLIDRSNQQSGRGCSSSGTGGGVGGSGEGKRNGGYGLGLDMEGGFGVLSELLGWTSLAAVVIYTFILPSR